MNDADDRPLPPPLFPAVVWIAMLVGSTAFWLLVCWLFGLLPV